MKRYSIPVVFAVALSGAPSLAQEAPGCFWIGPDGRFASLSSICPAAATAPAPATDLRPIAYADAYCQARRDGLPLDEARERGASAMQEVSEGQPIDDATIRAAVAKTAELCPGF